MGPHGDELPIDLRLVARYICVTEHVVSVQKVARRDHRGPMDARETMNRDGAARLQRGPHALVDAVDLLIRPFAIRRVPRVHRELRRRLQGTASILPARQVSFGGSNGAPC